MPVCTRNFARGSLLGLVFLAISCHVSPAQWIAFNDHTSGPGTHTNTTRYHALGEEDGLSGPLRNIVTGAPLDAVLTINGIGLLPDSSAVSGADPAPGTPLANMCSAFVDFAQASSAAPNNAGMRATGSVEFTFTGLDPAKEYTVHLGAVRGSTIENRWTHLTLLGVDGFVAAHSDGVLDQLVVPALGTHEAAVNFGQNHTPDTGDVVGWAHIQPGADGSFSVRCTKYNGTVPNGSSAGIVGYIPTALMFLESTPGEPATAILNPPTLRQTSIGSTASFSVSAVGENLAYQWFRNGAPIPGAHGTTLTIQSVQPEDNGARFSVRVTGTHGELTSAEAALWVTGIVRDLLSFDAMWRFRDDGVEPEGAWTSEDYDDSPWPEGPGLFGVESATLPVPLQTMVAAGGMTLPTVYLRTQFVLEEPFQDFVVRITHLIDDGAVVYLNGKEWYRHGMPAGAVGHETPANRTVGDANLEVLELPDERVLDGTNVLAVQVHQVNPNSTDLVWGLNIQVVSVEAGPIEILAPPEALDVDEGKPATFAIEAGGPRLVYQWLYEGDPIPGATNASHRIAKCSVTDAGQYSARVTSSIGDVLITDPVQLTVYPDVVPPLIEKALASANGFDIELTFSEAMDEITVADPSRYTVTNLLGELEPVEAVTWLAPDRVVLHLLNGYGSGNYFIAPNGIMDLAFTPNETLATPAVMRRSISIESFDGIWGYFDTAPPASAPDPGPNWNLLVHPDQLGWLYGAGAFAAAADPEELPVTVNTSLTPSDRAKYFIFAFAFQGSPLDARMTLRHVVDDGAVFYLNGQVILRFNMPEGAVTSETRASTLVDNASCVEASRVALPALRYGTNLLAVEVHGVAADFDLVFDAAMEIEVRSVADGPIVFLESPADATVIEGQSAVFTCDVVGAGEVQWLANGIPIPDAVGSRLELPFISYAMDGVSISVKASNPSQAMAVESEAAVISVTPDLTPPELESAQYAEDFASILVTFSEPLDPSTAEVALHYQLGTETQPGIETASAVMVGDRQVRLEFGEPAWPFWVLVVNGVRDRSLAGHGVAPNSRVAVGFERVLIGREAAWNYNALGMDLGTAWKERAYNADAWPLGPGVLGFPIGENLPANWQLRTVVPRVTPDGPTSIVTHYFRHGFDYPGPLPDVLTIDGVIDDGAIFYLNDAEIQRVAMPAGDVTFQTLATRATELSEYGEESFSVLAQHLASGINLAAVELHQGTEFSSDAIFGAELTAVLNSRSLPSLTVSDLSATVAGDAVVIRWLGEGFLLETSSTLNFEEADWNVIATESPYRISDAVGSRFFRLRSSTHPAPPP